MHKLILASLFALAGALPAQTCGSLAITGTGAAGTQLGIAVSNATAGQIAILIFGETAGSTTVPLPMGGSLVLGLDLPFFPAPIGRADASGAASVQVQIPAGLGTQYSLQGQAVLVGFSMNPFALNACASNVVPFTIG